MGLITGVAYKLFEVHIKSVQVKVAFVIITSLVVLGIFSYQLVLYWGLRSVAHGHYYNLKWIHDLLNHTDGDSDMKKAKEFHDNSNDYFGHADKLFAIICSGIFGHLVISGLIYIDVKNICLLSGIFFLSVFVGFLISQRLKT
jgi:hypothetical protein